MTVSELANLLVMYDQDADVLVQEGAELYDFSVEHFDNPGWEDLVLLRKKDLKTPPIEEIDYDNEDMGLELRNTTDGRWSLIYEAKNPTADNVRLETVFPYFYLASHSWIRVWERDLDE